MRLDEEETPKAPESSLALLEKALLDSRTILLTGAIDDQQARRVTERLIALSAISSDPILLIISSPGGHVESGDMIRGRCPLPR